MSIEKTTRIEINDFDLIKKTSAHYAPRNRVHDSLLATKDFNDQKLSLLWRVYLQALFKNLRTSWLRLVHKPF